MRFKSLAAAAALVLAGPAMAATCTGAGSLGSLGPPGDAFFGNAFTAQGSYLDCYTFSLTSAANSFGGTLELDPWLNELDIDVTTVSLFSGSTAAGSTTGNLVGADYTPGYFSFGALAAGAYTLAVSTTVTRDDGLWNAAVGYLGVISTSRASGSSSRSSPSATVSAMAGPSRR